MGFKCGIVGLPNVGKSTLFNALTQTATAAAENYPFCTIEPNIGQVPVPDPRLHEIARTAKSNKTIETQLMFVDIAGLVRGASKGEGLGNKFLGNIREVDAIIHILRCFEDSDVTHVEGKIDPVSDAETVETELMLSDLESLERRKEGFIKRARGNDNSRVARESIFQNINRWCGYHMTKVHGDVLAGNFGIGYQRQQRHARVSKKFGDHGCDRVVLLPRDAPRRRMIQKLRTQHDQCVVGLKSFMQS